MKPLVDRETAEKDVTAWLDKQHVKPRKRAEKEQDIEELVKAMMYGEVRLNDAGAMVQVLEYPAGGTKELVYENRVTVEDISVKTKNGGTDPFSVVAAYVSAITGITMGVARKMDNSDMALAGNIVAFF